MEIKISGKECKKILQDYAFTNFGKLMNCDKAEDMLVEIDATYSRIEKMTISKINIQPTETEA